MKILVVAALQGLHQPPSGGQSRLYNLVDQLITHGYDVTVLIPESFKDTKDKNVAEVIYYKDWYFRNRKLALIYDFNLSLIRKLLEVLKRKDYDIIQFSGPFGLITGKMLVKLLRKDMLLVYDAHNVESDLQPYIYENSPGYSFFEKSFIKIYVYLQEKVASKLCDIILAVSSDNKKRFIDKYSLSDDKIKIIPSGVCEPHFTTQPDKVRSKFDIKHDEKVVVFHGSYFYYPNKEAVETIKSFIAPEILRIYGDSVKFLIIGTDLPKFQTENIISMGFVEDLFSILSIADLAIVPLRGGDGTKIKIFDYLVMGLPVLSTKKGAEGIELVNGRDIIIVDEVDKSFIEKLIILLDDNELRKKLSQNSLKASNKYLWGTIGKKLHNVYQEAMKNEL